MHPFLRLAPLFALILFAAILLMSPADEVTATEYQARIDSTTTIVVVRHAEKANDGSPDPALSPAGEQRARALVEVLDLARVSAVYTTQFRRTRDTAAPLADQHQLPVMVREISSGVEAYAATLAEEILEAHAGGSVVVVGHSNTVPQIVEALSGYAVGEITEEEYDHLFVIVVPQQCPARVFQTRYGASSTE